MDFNLRIEINRLILLLLLASAIGYASEQISSVLLLAVAGFSLWQFRQLQRLNGWLKGTSKLKPLQRSRLWLGLRGGLWHQLQNQIVELKQRNIKLNHRLQAVINRIQDSTSVLHDAVLMINNKGVLEWWNKTAEEFLGLRFPVDQGQQITRLIRQPEFIDYLKQADFSQPLTMTSPVNSTLKLEINITFFGRKDLLVLIHDVTRLQQLEEMRKDFVANVSHELRTPLTVVAGYLETMQMAEDDMLPKRWPRMIEQMAQQSSRMQNIITDLLMLSQIENSQNNHSQIITVQPLIEQIWQDAVSLSGDKHHDIRIQIDSQCYIQGYENELRSAFSNLAFNAVKYTPAGRQIDLIWQQDNDGCYFIVKDNGEGIEQKHLPRLTERFYRGDPSRNNNTGGTGLGLAIVKHVMLRHQGELRISSELGKGSEFICYLPKQRCPSCSPEQASSDNRTAQAEKITTE